jgi:PTH1 family peptidyl-tRNA hydrolase
VDDIRMVVGLGNPGPRYGRTRHNVGFMVASELIRRGRRGADRMKDSALVVEVALAGRELLVVQPQTFMNTSGVPVSAVARRTGIEPSQILMVYDDADLPVGAIRVRLGGSPAGHKGVLSIVECLGTREVPRVRLGIGKDEGALADRVLAPFSRAEQPLVEQMISDAADAVEMSVLQGLTLTMNKYNRRAVPTVE